MSIRRHTDPSFVQHIWDAIKTLGTDHETVDLPKVTQYLQQEMGCTVEEAALNVDRAVSDNLILENKKLVNKSGKNVISVEGYRIPYEESAKPVNDGKDWYCIECHLAGHVQCCSNCHRVFHTECLKRNSGFPSNTLNFLTNKTSFSSNIPTQKNITVLDPVTAFNENGNIPNSFIVEPINTHEVNNIPGEKSSFNSSTSFEVILNGNSEEPLFCSLCKVYKAENNYPLIQEDLNYLLGFILERIKSWLPAKLTHKMDPKQQEEQWPKEELEWRAIHLWFIQISMSELQDKVKASRYEKLSEFQADVMTMRHNVAIFHGFDSQEYGAAELMLRDCCHELSELCVCADCYRHSNEKLNTNWFCLPCKNPHTLVWAKQKGYPYWPAKIIRETDTVYDVRFFGGKYERSVLPKAAVKPIDTPMDKLQIKHNASFKKALQELRLHQSLLNDESAVEKLLNETKWRKKKRRSSNPPKSLNKKPLIQVKQDIYEFPDGNQKMLEVAKAVKRTSTSPLNKCPKKLKSRQEINDVVSILDADEISIIRNSPLKSADTPVDQVTSSTEYIINTEDNAETQMQELDKPYSDVIEKMRRKLEDAQDKNELIIIAMNSMREEVDRIQAEHAEQLKKMTDDHAIQITETKRKQWCYNCQQDAIYHCCWNTAYCSPTCQQQHWQAEHKKVCRRKR